MPDVEKYYDEIDAARARRARELSDIKLMFTTKAGPDPTNINSRAVIVLTYASWEGFYNECVRAYISFLKERGGKVRDMDWMLLVGAFRADFNR
jgi:MAE_28990/MAE_18760-like HEPN